MTCPNKNDINWKVMVEALGELGAYAVFNEHGVPNIVDTPYYKNNPHLETRDRVLKSLGDSLIESNDLADTTVKEEWKRNAPIINNKKLMLDKLNKAISSAEKKKELTKVQSLKDDAELLEEEIEALERTNEIDDTIEQGNKDLNSAADKLSRDKVSDSDITLIDRILSTYAAGPTHLVTPEERLQLQGTEAMGNIAIIADRARTLLDRLAEHRVDNINEFVTENNGKGVINTLVKDIGSFAAKTLDISRISDSVINTLFVSVKKAMGIAHARTVDTMDELERLSKPLEEKYGMKEVYKKLSQQYSDGRATGSMVTKVAPEYQEKKFALTSEYLSHKKSDGAKFHHARDKYYKFIKENEIVMDARKLIGSHEGKAEHIADLKEILGSVEYERRMRMLTKKIETYEADKESVRSDYEGEFGEGDVAEEKISKWELEHSPYHYMEYLENPANPKFKGVRVGGYINTYSMPNKDKWYDPRFAEIEADKDLMAYYDFAMDTMSDLAKYLPANKRAELKSNSIPFVEKNTAELFDEGGFRAAGANMWSDMQKYIRTKDVSDTYAGYKNPLTGEHEDYLSAPSVDERTKVNELAKTKGIEFKAENGRDATQEEKRELYKDARVEIAGSKSFNINKVLGSYAMQVHAYEHKSAIEDQVTLIKHHVDNLEEQNHISGIPQKLPSGEKDMLSKGDSFKNMKASVGNFIDVAMYEKANEEEGIMEKTSVLTAKEKKRKKAIQESIDSGNLTEEEVATLKKEDAKIGGKLSISGLGNGMLQWVQLKGMGWNVLGGFSNLGFGQISNWTHAAGAEDFGLKNFAKASALSLKTIGGKATTHGKKIDNLMKKFDVLKEGSNELEVSGLNKAMKRFSPYEINKRTEYLNQAPVMIAYMMEQGIWEQFDEDGNYTGKGKDFSVEGKDFHKFKIQMDQIVKSLHGNYDPSSPLALKKKLWGRALSQFRTWMFESFNNRFEEQKYDEILERDRKGRYRSGP